MQIKGYIFSLLLSLTVMGIFQYSQKPQANQEVIFQFEEKLNQNETQQFLEDISSYLVEIGVEVVEVSTEDNIYRITYHSNSATKQVKKLLSESTKISFENLNDSNSEKDNAFNFDVFTINQGTSTSWDFEANEVYTLHLKSDRSFNPDVFKFPVLVKAGKLQINIKIACNACKQSLFVAGNNSYNIPEVRAGPLVTLSFVMLNSFQHLV